MTIKIDGIEIGESSPPYIIAEISGNHNGDINKALRLIEIAKECGVDAVKIQTYTPDTMTIDCDNHYFKIQKGPWKGYKLYDLYKWAYTPWEWHEEMFNKAKEVGITLFSTPFDETAVDFLEEFDVPAYKVASFEATDLILIEKIISKNKPMIISTGMANREEILEISNLLKKHNKSDAIFLHCVSGYPTPVKDSNVSAIKSLREETGFMTGLSDHTLNLTTSLLSLPFGARVIEKHFIESRNDKGPDSSFSLEPEELKALVDGTKEAWLALGDGQLSQRDSEKDSMVFRRSLFFVQDIEIGQVITIDHVRRIRPGYGEAPKHYFDVIGKKVTKNFKRGEPVNRSDLE